MSLPESIAVRYTEEEAGYISVRPVVRQTFRLRELLDMIVRVTGKDVPRLAQILRSGTIVYHFYRYWWQGFEAAEEELGAALAQFPDADPARPFDPGQCASARFDSGGPHPRTLLELDRATGSRRRIFAKQSFWERLLEIASAGGPVYDGYSYAETGDLYRIELDQQLSGEIAAAAKRLAPRNFPPVSRALPSAASLLLMCRRRADVAGEITQTRHARQQ